MTDLIKRLRDAWRDAGESEASVYDRKGFPPIGLQGHAHAPVADRQPAAIREAALQTRIEELENSLAWYQMMDAMSSDHVVELTDKLEAAEAKLVKVVEMLQSLVDLAQHGRFVLRELEDEE